MHNAMHYPMPESIFLGWQFGKKKIRQWAEQVVV
jgi:hypothetical protein